MGTRRTIRDADFSAKGLGWFGSPWPTGNLEGLYYFGNDFPNAPGWDYSLNGRDAAAVGAVSVATNHFTGGYFELPLTDAALDSQSRTLAVVIKRDAGMNAGHDAHWLGNYAAAETNALALGALAGTPGVYNMFGKSTSNAAQLLMTSATGTEYEMLFGVAIPNTVKLRRRSPTVGAGAGDATTTGPATYSPTSLPFKVGLNTGAWAPGDSIVSAAVWSKGLSDPEIAAFYAAQKAFLADYGVAI
jgi:hypothetical protein